MSLFFKIHCVRYPKTVKSCFDSSSWEITKMKTRLFAIMFSIAVFAGVSASTSWGQTSQSIQVEVPFAFTVNNKIHPAGRYQIEPASGGRALWRIRGSRKQRDEFLMAASLSGTAKGDLRVTFHRYKDKQFLAGFTTPSYDVSLPASHSEKALRLAMEATVPTEVINLQTVTGGSR